MPLKKSDLKPITYQQFSKVLDKLLEQIETFQTEKLSKAQPKTEHESGKYFDLIVPVLRSGAFTGMHLASKLGITNILPVQYKYIYEPEEHIVKKIEPPELLTTLPTKPHILIADTNTVFGGIARRVIADIRQLYSDASIYYASACLDYDTQQLPDTELVFYGQLTNEKRSLTATEAKAKGVTNDIYIFPWEDLDEQWQDIQTFM